MVPRSVGLRLLAAVVAIALALMACGPDPPRHGIEFFNRTGEPVRVGYVVNGVEQPQTNEQGEDTISNDFYRVYELDLFAAANARHCTTADIVDRTLDGHEVARIPPPVCQGEALPVELGITLINRTGKAVNVAYVVDGVSVPFRGTLADTIGVNGEKAFELDLFYADNVEHCTRADIIIRTLDGHEVTHFPPPVCEGAWLTFR